MRNVQGACVSAPIGVAVTVLQVKLGFCDSEAERARFPR